MGTSAIDVQSAETKSDDSGSAVSGGSLTSQLSDPTKASALGAGGGGAKKQMKELQDDRYKVRSGKREKMDRTSSEYLDVILGDALNSQVSLNAALQKIVGAVPASLGHVTHRDGSAKSAQEQLKGNARIQEKKSKYGNDYSGFTDISRASLVFSDPKKLLDSYAKVKAMLSAEGMAFSFTAGRLMVCRYLPSGSRVGSLYFGVVRISTTALSLARTFSGVLSFHSWWMPRPRLRKS